MSRRIFRDLGLGGLIAALGCTGSPAPPHEFSAGRTVMGTELEVTLYGPDPDVLGRAREDAFAEVERVDRLLSTWRPESEVSRLNDAAGGEMRVTPELAALLARSNQLARDTRGSFDITVGPLVTLWREADATGIPPEPEEIAAARARVGLSRLTVQRDGQGAIATLAPESALEFGGVVKGYALDRVRERIGSRVESALLKFGQSNAWAIGHPPGALGWRLHVRAPGGGYAGVLVLSDRALSMSEALGPRKAIGGPRHGRVIDPRSGEPLVKDRVALVVAPDATLAEALSKALLVLGASEGMTLMEAWPDVEALLLDAEGKAWRTSGWQALTQFQQMPRVPPSRSSAPPGDPIQAEWRNRI